MTTETDQHERRAAVGWTGTNSKTKVAMDKFRARKEKKRQATAKTLRAYKKACKSVGYSPGQGASRKRRYSPENKNEGVEDKNQDVLDHDGARKNEDGQNIKRRKKSSMFQKSGEKADRMKRERADRALEKAANEKERLSKLQKRREKTRKMRQRTSKGQPIMKHYVHDILEKLQKEKLQEKQS